MLSIGLMSGTSMDGIDAALLETDGEAIIREVGHTSLSYSPETKILLKAAEQAVRKQGGDLGKASAFYEDGLKDYLGQELGLLETDVADKVKQLSFYLHQRPGQPITLEDVIQHSTDLHGQTISKLLEVVGCEAEKIDVIGYHGQTLYHKPSQGISVIVGDGQALADQVGIMVVTDFRSHDVKAGGQGAPFAPLYHLALARRDERIPLAVLNCGGISNITLIQSNNELDLIGFDTGPGNGLIDRLVRQRTSGKESMDRDGQYGGRGTVNEGVLKALLEKAVIRDGQNFLQAPLPKALDIGDLILIDELDSLSLQDACRTLEALTAEAIVQSLDLLIVKIPQLWVLAGGGWNNPVILSELEQRLQKRDKGIKILKADDIGWNSVALEAQIFAYLAVRALAGKPFSFPGTTGVPTPLSGGEIYTPFAEESCQNRSSALSKL